jgi:hypothetical protein
VSVCRSSSSIVTEVPSLQSIFCILSSVVSQTSRPSIRLREIVRIHNAHCTAQHTETMTIVPNLSKTTLLAVVVSVTLWSGSYNINVESFQYGGGGSYQHQHQHNHHRASSFYGTSLLSSMITQRQCTRQCRHQHDDTCLSMTVTTAELVEQAATTGRKGGKQRRRKITFSSSTTSSSSSSSNTAAQRRLLRLNRTINTTRPIDECRFDRDSEFHDEDDDGGIGSGLYFNNDHGISNNRSIGPTIIPTKRLSSSSSSSSSLTGGGAVHHPEKDGIITTTATTNANNNNNNLRRHDKLLELGIDIPFGLRQQLLTNAYESIHKRIWILDNSGSMNIMDGHQVLLDQQSQQQQQQQHDPTTTPPTTNNDHNSILCSRWLEVQETVQCHAQLSSVLGIPTDFHLLNPPKIANGPFSLLRGQQTFRVGYKTTASDDQHRNSNQSTKDLKRVQNVMVRTEPNGQTPLAQSITNIRREIVSLQSQLELLGQKVCLVIATDGSNYTPRNVDRMIRAVSTVNNNNDNNGSSAGGGGTKAVPLLESTYYISEEERQRDVIEALSSLQGLPVVVVIRLCTDHQPLVDFYSTCLDRAGVTPSSTSTTTTQQQQQQHGDYQQDDNDDDDLLLCRTLLEVDIDVLDDHVAEAKEVHKYNPWLNYALIVHRMREMGQDSLLFDLLDERSFDRKEIFDFVCNILFGTTTTIDDQHPRWNVFDDLEWSKFVQQVGLWQQKERKQFNPITNSMEPWIDVQALLAMPS